MSILLLALRSPGQIASFSLADWNLLLRQSTSANLTPTLLATIEEAGTLDQVPHQARAQLDWSRALATRHRQAVGFEVDCIQSALRPTGLPLILLKGAAYTMAGLRAGEGRLYGDIDILVPKSRLDEVESALMLHGWASTHHDAYDQRYYREWMHELPPMHHVRRQTNIDVHHAIVPETAAARPDPAKLRAAAVTVADAGDGLPPVQVLAPHDMVLHSAVHLFSDGEFKHGLRDLFDIHRLLLEFGGQAGFWAGLAPRARALELERPLFYALRYAVRLFNTPVPDTVLADAGSGGGSPGRALLALMDRLFLRGLAPAHPSCADALTPLALSMLYVRGNWLRMPPLLLSRHLFHKAFITPRVDAGQVQQ
ncbi:nucleotidyltransferase family protein [Massilia aerilata]|uniref:Nucleotidyltransferase family protein n=1 Tax=Massilia aerilata TaxID=453817 RepID=A0ABW0S5C8_9BURK